MNDVLRSSTPTPLVRDETKNELEQRLDEAIRRTQTYLLRIQNAGGYWHFPLEANVTMDAEYIFFNRFMQRDARRQEARVVDHMLATQNDDGSWSLYPSGPGHVSLTIEAYFALKLCGFSPSEPRLQRAAQFIRAHGGLARAGVFTRCFLAYFGQFPWYGLPAMPVELILLPPWFPVNIYALSSWARETVVPLTILMALRPQVAISPEASVADLWLEPPSPAAVAFSRSPEFLSWRNFFLLVDSTLKTLGRYVPWAPLRHRAIERAERWILERQDRNGGWGGIQPPMLNCVMALKTLGYPDSHPAIANGIQAIDDFLIADGDSLMMQPCVSPTWDTALAAKALLDSGLNADHPALARAADWLIQNQIFRRGDWSVYNPDLDPGGWAFEFANDWYPDVDDTAVILMQLRRIATKDQRAQQRAIAYGLNWALGMQSQNGGWAAFDTDNDSEFLNQIPFADMEAMIDPPTEDLTGRLLELMGNYGYDLESSRARKAHRFLLRTQRPSGAWWGRWGANFIYGTWSVLAGLRAIGDDLRATHIRRAVAWLKQHQNPDGGWGETLASYDNESLAGQGESTPSQTAWAILGLLAGEPGMSDAVLRGVRFLLDTQNADGTWPERLWTGTGFPRHFYLRYDGYRIYFPLMALGQARQRLRALRSSPPSPTTTRPSEGHR
ncbi:MAG: squalene-hopene cyclase [Candidatus Binatia bacterium]|nr:MAG: squalene-hopene cyclase [Candidatus Binatia bacterium]